MKEIIIKDIYKTEFTFDKEGVKVSKNKQGIIYKDVTKITFDSNESISRRCLNNRIFFTPRSLNFKVHFFSDEEHYHALYHQAILRCKLYCEERLNRFSDYLSSLQNATTKV